MVCADLVSSIRVSSIEFHGHDGVDVFLAIL